MISKGELVSHERLADFEGSVGPRLSGSRGAGRFCQGRHRIREMAGRTATDQQKPQAAMTLDHGFYPDGEVLWGRFNATVAVTADEGFETGDLLREWCVEAQKPSRCHARGDGSFKDP